MSDTPNGQVPQQGIYCPPALIAEKQWLGWALDGDNKIPIDIHKNPSGSTRVDDYRTFGEIVEAGRNPAFCFTAEDDYVGIDLDDCIVDNKLLPWADQICEAFAATYIELSPSKTGVHIICSGKKPDGSRCSVKVKDLPWTDDDAVGGIEVYERGRFFTHSGMKLSAAGADVVDQQDQIDWLFENHLKRDQPTDQPTATVQAQENTQPASDKRAQAYADAVPGVSDGERNNTCFKLAGHLYHGMDVGYTDLLRLVGEFNARCTPPLPAEEVQKAVVSGITNGTPPAPKGDRPIGSVDVTYSGKDLLESGWTPNPDQWEQLGLQPNCDERDEVIKAIVEGGVVCAEKDGRRWMYEIEKLEDGYTKIKFVRFPLPIEKSVSQRKIEYPNLKPIIIEGLMREQEVSNVVAAPKVGKSWFAMQMAVSVALGLDFLGRKTHQRKVFVVDDELHTETSVDRLEMMCAAMKVTPSDLDGKLVTDNLRGSLHSLDELDYYFCDLSDYGLVVCDALYRLLPKGISENDNAAMTGVYNTLDKYAERTGAAICCIHHTSKGDQTAKSKTDIGSGAGSQSRAADAHISLLPHEMEDCVVMGGVVRSFVGEPDLTLKREFPMWVEKPMIPATLRDAGKDKQDREEVSKKEEEMQEAFDALLAAGNESSLSKIKSEAKLGRERISRGLKALKDEGLVVELPAPNARTGEVWSVSESCQVLESYDQRYDFDTA